MQDEEEQAEEEQTIIAPAEATPPMPEVVEVPEPEEEPGELDDLFEVPQPEDNDMRTDIALDMDEEDIIGGDPDMSDLVDVSEEDIMGGGSDMSDLVDIPEEVFTGEPPAPEPEQVQRPVVKKKYRFVRPIRREPPPTSLGGIR